MKIINASEVFQALTPAQAVQTLRDALRNFDPAQDSVRQSLNLQGGGDLLLMPSSTQKMAGIKVLTMNPDAEQTGTPMIQGQYLLFEGHTLAPIAILDGAAITSLRTPAVSVATILDFINHSAESLKVVICGTGPQGRHHEETLQSALEQTRPIHITYLSRTQPQDLENWVESNSDPAKRALAEAELIICATSAQNPILFTDDVRDNAVIVALGSHTPTAREVDGELMARSQVILEDRATAERECGDIIQAVEEGKLSYEHTVNMRDVILGNASLNRESPIIFKFSGMGWEDLAIAHAVFQKLKEES
ncbi:ornithine cyclodeaminase family protein [uncultured Rothia sp.]|uniref:ornithine cyclodeaminase family protein n=1 Tax=uncultured Rothia sp. TaxID=316088 RepID=UPI003216C183